MTNEDIHPFIVLQFVQLKINKQGQDLCPHVLTWGWVQHCRCLVPIAVAVRSSGSFLFCPVFLNADCCTAAAAAAAAATVMDIRADDERTFRSEINLEQPQMAD